MTSLHTMAARFSLALAAVCVAAAAGCGTHTERVYFRPVGTPEAAGPGWVAEGKYRLPPGAGLAEVTISARGTIEKTKEAGLQEWISLKFQVQNRGSAAFALDPAKVHILDDDGNQVGGVATAAGTATATTAGAATATAAGAATAATGGTPSVPIVVAGGKSLAFELRFTLPAQVRLANIGSIRAVWPYRYADTPYEAATKFIKIEEVTYYEPGYYYGPYYGPYYDPYYGPYYGPYGTWGHRYYFEEGRRRR